MRSVSYLRVNNNNDVIITGLRRSSDGTFINDAELQFTLYQSDGITVVPGAQDIPMPYEAGSNGNYRGTLDVTAVTLTPRERYYIKVVDVNLYADILEWWHPVAANYRI